MSQNIEKLTSSIADGFLLLKQMMAYQQPPTMYHPQAYNPYGSPNSFAPRMPSAAGYSPSSCHSHSFTSGQSDDFHFDIEDQ